MVNYHISFSLKRHDRYSCAPSSHRVKVLGGKIVSHSRHQEGTSLGENMMRVIDARRITKIEDRLIMIELLAAPADLVLKQAFMPISVHEDEEVK